MSALSDLANQHADLSENEIEWLHLLVGDWQIIADLAYADLVLWLPDRTGSFVAIAHVRSNTGATVYYDDIVGTHAPVGSRSQLETALRQARHQRSRVPRWFGAYAVREEAVPVVFEGRAIAVIARETNLGSGRTPSRMELNLVEAADDIMAMISRGEYPFIDAAVGQRRGAPRVGDGLIRLNAEGEVLYASPNALSCFHRMGIISPLVGESLVEITSCVVEYQGTVDEGMPLVLTGRAPWRTEIETSQTAVAVRSIPITDHGSRTGAVLMCRDVTELRRRERDLMTKDATIREIHHRVKNNLATVAALLRLQSRRVTVPEAKAALDEATRRVATISLVHEFLSQTLDEQVDLDNMLNRALRMTAEVASTTTQIRTVQTGSFGMVPAENATALALVLTELVTNAVEHGFPDGREVGTVQIDVHRDGQALHILLSDDGVGLSAENVNPAGEAATALLGAGHSGLGNQIVRTLVANELGGSIEWRQRQGGGTQVRLEARLMDARAA